MRVGVDVGGTNTDAVAMVGRSVQGAIKSPTTPHVTTGIVSPLRFLGPGRCRREDQTSGWGEGACPEVVGYV